MTLSHSTCCREPALSRGWTLWSPEVPSNSYHSMTLDGLGYKSTSKKTFLSFKDNDITLTAVYHWVLFVRDCSMIYFFLNASPWATSPSYHDRPKVIEAQADSCPSEMSASGWQQDLDLSGGWAPPTPFNGDETTIQQHSEGKMWRH